MKKILLVTILIASLGSCKKGDTANTQASISIVGTWHYTKERIQVLSATNAVLSDETTTSFPAGQDIQYNADGTGVANDGTGGLLDFSYNITGNTDTEYQTPKSVGEQPYVFTITLTSSTLTKHSSTTANNQTTIVDDDLSK